MEEIFLMEDKMNILDKLLRSGATEIDIEVIKEVGEPTEIKEEYEKKGWLIEEKNDYMIFNKPNRQLLKG